MILDYIDHLEFNPGTEDYLFDAEETLARLSQGLFWLYNYTKNFENKVLTRKKDINEIYGLAGKILPNTPSEWLSSAFIWYSISINNYCRLVAWLSTNDLKVVNKYPRKIIPRVVMFRHKVAAHFAITDPGNDNLADLRSSIMTKVIFTKGTLVGGAVSEVYTDENGHEIRKKHNTSWSLVRTHEKLMPRFWPKGPIEVSEALQLSATATRKFLVRYPGD